jgi:cytochrome c-type biogenesis protein CcmH/NrfF
VQRHRADVTSLLSGLLFLGVGTTALVAGSDHFADALRWVWPVTLLILGVALLVRSGGKHRSGDEVGAERGEDREVEQAGRSHDG